MKRRTELATIALSALLTLSGCATQSASVFDADQRLASKEFQIDPVSYGVGCVTGAVVGGTIGLATSGSIETSAAGALAGCAVGTIGNKVLDEIRESYFTKESQLDALITRLEQNYQKVKQLYVVAEQVYKEDHAKFAKLDKKIKNNTATIEELRLKLARYEGNIDILREQLSAHRAEIKGADKARLALLGKEDIDEALLKDEKYLKETFTKEEIAKLKQYDKQIAMLHTQLEDMKNVINSYTADRNVLNLTLSQMEPECYLETPDPNDRTLLQLLSAPPKEPRRRHNPQCKLHNGKAQRA